MTQPPSPSYRSVGREAYKPATPDRGRFERSRKLRDSVVSKAIVASAFHETAVLTEAEMAEYKHVCDFVANSYVCGPGADKTKNKFAEVCRGCQTFRGARDPSSAVE